MLAPAEARGDVAGIHRRAQERAHDALALGIVELVGAALRAEADHGDGALQETQLARQQAALVGDLAVAGDQLLEQHDEALAGLQLALEVDVVGERLDELAHRRRRRAGLDAALSAASPAISVSTRTMRGLTL